MLVVLDHVRIRMVPVTVHITWIQNTLAAARDGNLLTDHPIITGTVTALFDEMYFNDVNELPCAADYLYVAQLKLFSILVFHSFWTQPRDSAQKTTNNHISSEQIY